MAASRRQASPELGQGIPQGGPAGRSGHQSRDHHRHPAGRHPLALLANLALSALDDDFVEEWQRVSATFSDRQKRRKLGLPNARVVRYADDFVILVFGNREQAMSLWDRVAAVLDTVGLKLAPDKTRVVHIDEGFDFLGFRIKRDTQRGSSKRYIYTYPSRKAVAAIMRKVKEATKQAISGTLADLVKHLNSVLQGWANYCVSRGHAPDELKEVRPTIQMAQPASSSPPTGVSPVQVVARVPGSRLAASGGNAWRRSPASRASLEGATERSAASKRSLPRRQTNPKGTRGSRARSIRAKATEGAKNLEVQRRGTPRRKGRGTFGRWWRELERPSPAPGTAAWEQPARITAKREVASSRKGVGWGHT